MLTHRVVDFLNPDPQLFRNRRRRHNNKHKRKDLAENPVWKPIFPHTSLRKRAHDRPVSLSSRRRLAFLPRNVVCPRCYTAPHLLIPQHNFIKKTGKVFLNARTMTILCPRILTNRSNHPTQFFFAL
jgi:hypothetical protein